MWSKSSARVRVFLSTTGERRGISDPIMANEEWPTSIVAHSITLSAPLPKGSGSQGSGSQGSQSPSPASGLPLKPA